LIFSFNNSLRAYLLLPPFSLCVVQAVRHIFARLSTRRMTSSLSSFFIDRTLVRIDLSLRSRHERRFHRIHQTFPTHRLPKETAFSSWCIQIPQDNNSPSALLRTSAKISTVSKIGPHSAAPTRSSDHSIAQRRCAPRGRVPRRHSLLHA